ncbi:MAG TPA: hypothetical protein VGW58_16915 [Pyrinomonadaceae bacterium]|nr:hypothetical protein [Pyrinomonadaceae bacterium]
MFIRFVSGEIHEDSRVSAGLFTAAFHLLDDPVLPYDDYRVLRGLMDWFNEYLKGPSDYRWRAAWRAERAICWFKSTAFAHLSRAWEMAAILERNDVFVWTIKVQRTGYILYQDEAQVFAEPFADIRRVL